MNSVWFSIRNSIFSGTEQFFPGTQAFASPTDKASSGVGLSESVKNICKKYGIQVHFQSRKSIKDELVAPKDKDHLTKKSGIIYRYKCDRLECDEEYIGETARTFGERYKEHLKAPSPIYDHSNTTGHNITLNNFSIVGREEQNLSG